MKKFLFILPIILLFCSCGVFEGEDSNSDDNNAPVASADDRDRDIDEKLSLALGGVGEGMDEIFATGDLNGQILGFDTAEPSMFDFDFISGFDTFNTGGGGRVVPKEVGIGSVWYTVAGRRETIYSVTVPPQKLIQILIGEAGGQLIDEADDLADGSINPKSVSPTGDAVAAVVRNRVKLIDEEGNPALFAANKTDYYSDAPLSSYNAVIEAVSAGGFYQFNPVDESDLNNERYLAAENRDTLGDLDDDFLLAYDQAVLTAADVFNDDLDDPTGGAFAFYTPTDSQWAVLQTTLTDALRTLPSGAGTSNAAFPFYSPVQVLILSGIATKTSTSDVPAFVFVRARESDEPAVTDAP